MQLQQGQHFGSSAVLVVGSCACHQRPLASASSLAEQALKPSVSLHNSVSHFAQQQLLLHIAQLDLGKDYAVAAPAGQGGTGPGLLS